MYSGFYFGFFGILCLTVLTSGQYEDSPRIYSLHIRSEIQFRFATTLITSRVANPSNYSQETTFEVILPEEAFISNFTIEIDGVVYPGIVKEKEQARKDYEKAKKKGRTTGLVSQKARESRTFKVEITVAALSKITFNLTYQELLKRAVGMYEHRVFVDPGYPVQDLQIVIGILESRDITRLMVPPIRDLKGLLTNDYLGQENGLAVIDRPSSRTAFIRYSPGPSEQGDKGVSGQFIVRYDIDRSLDGGDVLVVNGYFVHFLAPDIQTAIGRDVMFVLDVSGSMDGTKLVQLKESMYSILDELNEGDRFNIITFHQIIQSYKKHMADVSTEEILKAKSFISNLKADGGTNINAALLGGIKDLSMARESDERSPLLVFLTDGQPTSGETNAQNILRNIVTSNGGEVPIFGLAFGKDADWDLVKNIAVQNNGIGRRIYEDSDAALQIRGFYEELAVTLLNNVSVKYLGDSVDDESITKSNFKNYFKGTELVVAGRLTDAYTREVDLEIVGQSTDGELVLKVDKNANIIDISRMDGPTKLMNFESITEKTWAYLSIKQLIERATGEPNTTAAHVMKERAKELSLKYGFVTPLTSMVVVKPELDEDDLANTRHTTTPKPTTRFRTTKPKPTTRYHKYRGGGAGGRGYGGGGGGDPHFMIRIKDIEHPLCFDFPTKEGEIINLITDPRKRITINTEVIGGEIGHHGQKTYMGKISIRMSHHQMMVTPEVIVFDSRVFTWDDEIQKHFGGHEFFRSDEGNLLTIRFTFGAVILIRRHVNDKGPKAGLKYLNIYVKHEDGFSKKTTGLIGQFVNGYKHVFLRKMFTSQSGKHMAKFQVKEGLGFQLEDNEVDGDTRVPSHHRIPANLIQRSDVIEKGTEMCWQFHKQFEEKLYGRKDSLLRPTLI